MHFIKTNFIKHQRTVLLILLFLVVGTMTVGYASFQTILTLGGTITLPKLERKIFISNVEYNSGENVISLDPVINDRSVLLTDSYSSNMGSSTYIVTLFNYTDSNYIYNGFSSSDESNNLDITYTLSTTVSNILPGDIIGPGEIQEIIVTMNYSGNNVDSVEISNNIELYLETDPVGSLSVELLTDELDYGDNNPISLNVVNTLISERYVDYRIDNNKFELVDINGNLLETQKYDSGYMDTETIYIRIKSGVELTQDENVSLYEYVNGSSVLLGSIIVKVSVSSFANDSWEKINNAVSSGTYSYKVGDTKCVHLDGYSTTNDNGCNGDFLVRVANTSNPEECSNDNFSQSACGFVLEFVDIITLHEMNSINTNAGGWASSLMRMYLNDDIYDALPEDLQDIIINTKTVSGHGSKANEVNSVSDDKLFLLSAHEIWSNDIGYDTAYDDTRQLDYYSDLKVSTKNKNAAIKNFNLSPNYWFLRTAYSNVSSMWIRVHIDGGQSNTGGNVDTGVSPAFRIGNNTSDESASFANDSWEKINNAVSSGTYSYKVGDTKCVHLDGYSTTNDNGCNGDFLVRVANTSNPEECSTEGFSQTACGFVIEFVDIITLHEMNNTDTNVGGWPVSSMKTFVNNDIYNSLPEDLQDLIINTNTISGHGDNLGETNFSSTDKLYLLSLHELYDDQLNYFAYDTAWTNTRQLDYYENLGVTTTNYGGAIKKQNGIPTYWWLRTPWSALSAHYAYPHPDGSLNVFIASVSMGVSPAFRFG